MEGEGLKRVNLSLKDLTTMFKKHTVTATLQCTGNRRDMFNEVKPVKGLEWGVGALPPALLPCEQLRLLVMVQLASRWCSDPGLQS